MARITIRSPGLFRFPRLGLFNFLFEYSDLFLNDRLRFRPLRVFLYIAERL